MLGYNGLCAAQPTFRFIHIIPGTLSSQNIFNFLLLHVLALVVALVDDKVVGAGQAFEAVLADKIFGRRVAGWYCGDAQHVAACWADWRDVSCEMKDGGVVISIVFATGISTLTEQHGEW